MAGGGNLPIGPGIWGFIAFFVLAVALWFLVRNMNSRLRRMAYRDRERAEAEANTLTSADAPADAEGLRRAEPGASPESPGGVTERGTDDGADGQAPR